MQPGRTYSAGNQYRYGFNGKENDRDINEGGQDYGLRIYDTRIARFLSVDPLAKAYASWSPYPFAMNRPVDGVDMDGLEYVSANKVRIKFRNGVVSLKFENLHTVTQNSIKAAYSCHDQFGNVIPNTEGQCTWHPCPGNPDGCIGMDLTLGYVNFESPTEKQEPASILDNGINGATKPTTEDVGTIPQGIEKNKTGPRRGLPDGRVKPRDPTTSAGPGGAKALAGIQVVIMGIELGADLYVKNRLGDDESKVNSNINQFKKAAADVNYALSNGLIPREYQTSEYISDIVNVVLSGESIINSYDQKNGAKILEIGMNIYNTLSVKRNQYKLVSIYNALWHTSSLIQVIDPKYDAQYVKDNPPLGEAPKPKK